VTCVGSDMQSGRKLTVRTDAVEWSTRPPGWHPNNAIGVTCVITPLPCDASCCHHQGRTARAFGADSQGAPIWHTVLHTIEEAG
jgi:hypothetical protein